MWLWETAATEASWRGDALLVELRYFAEVAEAAIAAEMQRASLPFPRLRAVWQFLTPSRIGR